jgi:hypothetical protein
MEETGKGEKMTKPNYGETVRLTVAQAVLKFLAAQYSVSDGVRRRFSLSSKEEMNKVWLTQQPHLPKQPIANK